ncbi:hypothetical protein PUNSTDRAFT_128091 [Punctularia strigosozonata HHB-11173 SS5]|uniref:F-box domain-containing protein n=1 Tax=Punctularia strigosozonata (strain HHB-11173) TaxID=741275 RepID=R7S4P4_PUNST|nr:uncharacterized protein PUNSTDRAFT_128091 [Punctularia strigosozonata HHB-11173 SS5]EIN04839.1 hypothetical protein PUNSTDRAFT_128091 [Punctularia strigosozonata HHB-11173 SS5]
MGNNPAKPVIRIDALPEDLILEIALQLDFEDLLAFKQTCRIFHLCACSDYLSRRLALSFHLPLDIDPWEELSALSGREIQRRMVRALKLDKNWSRGVPRIKQFVHIRGHVVHNDELSIGRMALLPGAQWLLTVQSNRRRGRTSATCTFWSLHDVRQPYRAACLEVSGQYMFSTAETACGKSPATYAVTYTQSGEDFLDVYNVPLEQRWAPIDSVTGTPQLLLRVRRPPDCPGVMYKVRLMGDFVATTISRDGSPYGVLVVCISSGHRVLLELPSIGELQGSYIEFVGDDLVIVTSQFDGVMVDKIAIPALFACSDPESSSCSASTIRLKKPRTIWAGVPIHPDAIVSFGASPGPRMTGWRLSHVNVLSFGQSLYLARIPPSTCTSSNDADGTDADSGPSDLPRSATRPAGLTSQDSTALGPWGHRAVWLERNWEDEHVRLMKMSASPPDHHGRRGTETTDMGIKLGVLVPPVPNLPFRPAECRSLAFDEAKGRVVLGLYSGDLCVLDFVED